MFGCGSAVEWFMHYAACMRRYTCIACSAVAELLIYAASQLMFAEAVGEVIYSLWSMLSGRALPLVLL